MEKVIALIIGGICAAVCSIISIRQFQEKGFLFNNAYIYASKKERKNINKKPHYRQSAIVFALLTMIFIVIELEILLDTGWLNWLEGGLVAVTLVYVVVSGVKMERKI